VEIKPDGSHLMMVAAGGMWNDPLDIVEASVLEYIKPGRARGDSLDGACLGYKGPVTADQAPERWCFPGRQDLSFIGRKRPELVPAVNSS